MNQKLFFEEMIQAARQACNQIESVDFRDPSSLLTTLIDLLRCADVLSHCSIQDESEKLVIVSDDYSSRLTNIPEDFVFHGTFDPLDATSVCSNTLKDCLGDIYSSLKGGLIVLDKEPPKKLSVLWEWQSDYKSHWGRHLIDVIRFLILCQNIEKTVVRGKNGSVVS